MQAAQRYVVFDLETTGLSWRGGDRVIEIGAVAVEGSSVAGEFHSLVRTGRAIHPAAQRVHGISEEMLEGHPEAPQVFSSFHRFIEGSVLVAHNATFDVNFLRNEFHLAGL
ncbi:MAG TPA: 3'-5' exonuclease, partial [Verrucomicrobiae bacterium]|nr:3'-5' exonuclease [Verrucomicrobiae bacterium]